MNINIMHAVNTALQAKCDACLEARFDSAVGHAAPEIRQPSALIRQSESVSSNAHPQIHFFL
jgi:hypothetical protein